MANIGYARVSTDEQNLDMQLDALAAAGCVRVFQDKLSGATMDRPELELALHRLEEGDTLIVWKLDRLSRSTIHCLQLLKDLAERGVTFKSLTDGVQTTGAMGKAYTTMLMAFAEMERDLIRERTLAGMEAARARGVKFGRHAPKKQDEEARKVVELTEKGLTRKEVAKVMGISEPTVYRRQQYARQQLSNG
jgi:DNA invertase Pin-like site-specific DNA recombinase